MWPQKLQEAADCLLHWPEKQSGVGLSAPYQTRAPGLAVGAQYEVTPPLRKCLPPCISLFCPQPSSQRPPVELSHSTPARHCPRSVLGAEPLCLPPQDTSPGRAVFSSCGPSRALARSSQASVGDTVPDSGCLCPTLHFRPSSVGVQELWLWKESWSADAQRQTDTVAVMAMALR